MELVGLEPTTSCMPCSIAEDLDRARNAGNKGHNGDPRGLADQRSLPGFDGSLGTESRPVPKHFAPRACLANAGAWPRVSLLVPGGARAGFGLGSPLRRKQERDACDQVDVAGVGRVGTYTRPADATRLGESREPRAGRARQRLASWLISWPLGSGGHVFANRAGDRVVDESSCDARDTRDVGGPSTAMHDVVPGVFHELEVRSVVDAQLGHAGTDERDQTISLLFAM